MRLPPAVAAVHPPIPPNDARREQGLEHEHGGRGRKGEHDGEPAATAAVTGFGGLGRGVWE